jgi:hypothetical protein
VLWAAAGMSPLNHVFYPFVFLDLDVITVLCRPLRDDVMFQLEHFRERYLGCAQNDKCRVRTEEKQ